MKREAKETLALALLLTAIAALYCTGCGGTPAQQHRTLNSITSVADPSYVVALEGCNAARDAIVEREGTTYEADRAAMDEINDVCDAIVTGFETLRGTQLTARAAIDAGASAAVAQAITEALALWARLQAMVPELATLGEAEE